MTRVPVPVPVPVPVRVILLALACDSAPPASPPSAPAVEPEPTGPAYLTCKAVAARDPAFCRGDASCRERYAELIAFDKEMLGVPDCGKGADELRALCRAAVDGKIFECEKVAKESQPFCTALATHAPGGCNPGGGPECHDRFHAAVAITRGSRSDLDAIRDPALKLAVRAVMGPIDCAKEARRMR